MKMIQAVIRIEKADEIAQALLEAGYPSMTRMDVYGRGKQKGLQVGSVFYDELPKKLMLIVAQEKEVKDIIDIICEKGKTGAEGNYGDGRIFVSEVEETYTISSKKSE